MGTVVVASGDEAAWFGSWRVVSVRHWCAWPLEPADSIIPRALTSPRDTILAFYDIAIHAAKVVIGNLI